MDKIWYVIGTLALLVLIAAVMRGGRVPAGSVVSATPAPTALETVLPTPTLIATATPTPRPVTRPRPTVKPPVATPAMVAEQFSGNRIQFDIFCHAFPVENTYQDGKEVMLDNRSPDDRVVTIGGVQHSIVGYGWYVVKMTSETLPTTWAIDCGSAKNVGKIVIEPMPTHASSSEPLVSTSPDVSTFASVSPSSTPIP